MHFLTGIGITSRIFSSIESAAAANLPPIAPQPTPGSWLSSQSLHLDPLAHSQWRKKYVK